MASLGDDDYYSPWEWQPASSMSWGCVDVSVRLHDGEVKHMCSCDYWWANSQGESWVELVEGFRYD